MVAERNLGDFFITFVSGIPKLSYPNDMKILIDNGHGLNTPGKRSPDGQFLEAIYNREIAKRIVAELQNKGYDAELLVPEEEDISLNERVRRTNECLTFVLEIVREFYEIFVPLLYLIKIKEL